MSYSYDEITETYRLRDSGVFTTPTLNESQNNYHTVTVNANITIPYNGQIQLIDSQSSKKERRHMDDSTKKSAPKRRFGDRRDGRLVKAPGLQTVMGYLFPKRTDCEVYLSDTVDATELLKFLDKKFAGHNIQDKILKVIKKGKGRSR